MAGADFVAAFFLGFAALAGFAGFAVFAFAAAVFFAGAAFFTVAADFVLATGFALTPALLGPALLLTAGLAAAFSAARGLVDLAVGFLADLLAAADFAVAIS
ncbi:MAG: hypothetical protein VCD31_04575 [Alphaproteobacteria bacterium]